MAKKYFHQIGSNYSKKVLSAAEKYIKSLRSHNHPMILGILDLVKDKNDYPCIIME